MVETVLVTDRRQIDQSRQVCGGSLNVRQKRTLKIPIWIGLLILFALSDLSAGEKTPGRFTEHGKPENTLQREDRKGLEKDLVHLYFATRDNDFLTAEERMISSSDPVNLAALIIRELITGSRKNLVRTIPEKTKLNAVFITGDGIAYVDISEAARRKHPGGVQSERLTIFSIVNSLILNIAEIKAVKILIQGKESMTLAGHIDLRFPFKANMLIVR
jgi:spore germination protein GerM